MLVAHKRTTSYKAFGKTPVFIVTAVKTSNLTFGKSSRAVKNAVFWDDTPSDSCTNRHFGGIYRLHHQGDKNRRTRNNVSSN
jgi:hypothetical protein